MPALRAVLVMVPPLLADLIRHVLTGRIDQIIVAEARDPADAARMLRDVPPDIVILGPHGTAGLPDPQAVRALLPRARVLALSADLAQLLGPEEGEVCTFTPDTLAGRVRRAP